MNSPKKDLHLSQDPASPRPGTSARGGSSIGAELAQTIQVHPSPAIVYIYGAMFLGVLFAKSVLFVDVGWFDGDAGGWAPWLWRTLVVIGVLVLGYHYLARITSVYEINPLEISTDIGILSKRRDAAPLNRITNFQVDRPFVQRLLGQANLLVDTAGGDGVELKLKEMKRKDAEQFAKLLTLQLGQQKIVEAGSDQHLRSARSNALDSIAE